MDTINNFIQISKEEFKKELEDKSIVLDPQHCTGFMETPGLGNGTHHILYVNIYNWKGKKRKQKCFEFDLKNPSSFTQKVPYMRFQRKREFPKGGVVFVTIEKDGVYTHGICKEWNPEPFEEGWKHELVNEYVLHFTDKEMKLMSKL